MVVQSGDTATSLNQSTVVSMIESWFQVSPLLREIDSADSSLGTASQLYIWYHFALLATVISARPPSSPG